MQKMALKASSIITLTVLIEGNLFHSLVIVKSKKFQLFEETWLSLPYLADLVELEAKVWHLRDLANKSLVQGY